MTFNRMYRRCGLVWLLVPLLITMPGCDAGPQVAPVSGTVTYDGEPLRFGVVMFQPSQGQLAQADIESDGSFTLSTFKPGDGAIVGEHRVSVSCYEGHNPEVREKQPPEQLSLGQSLIPVKYSRVGTSGITIEVPPEGLDDVQIVLEK